MNKLLVAATKVYLRIGGSKFKEVSVIKLPNEEEIEIIVFSNKKPLLIGQHTPFHTIIVHELVFQRQNLLSYVGVHENFHKKQWYGYFLYPLIVFCILSALGTLCFTITSLVYLIIRHELNYLWGSIIGLADILVFTGIPCIASWLVEGRADYQAIKILGIEAVLNAKSDSRELFRHTQYQKIINRMTHPPISWTYKVYRKLHRYSEITTDK